MNKYIYSTYLYNAMKGKIFGVNRQTARLAFSGIIFGVCMWFLLHFLGVLK